MSIQFTSLFIQDSRTIYCIKVIKFMSMLQDIWEIKFNTVPKKSIYAHDHGMQMSLKKA